MEQNYDNFDWVLYIDEYSLKQDISDKENAWNYFQNIGKSNNHIYYNIHQRGEFERMRDNFDWELYLNTYEDVKNHGTNGIYATWWHYNHFGKDKGYQYFSLSNNSLQPSNVVGPDDLVMVYHEPVDKEVNVYYYVDHVINTDLRSGIQVLTIYIAKYLLKKKINIVFVKWDNSNNQMVPCTVSNIHHMFNYRNAGEIIPPISYTNYSPIHYNSDYPHSKFVLFIPELTFSRENYVEKIKKYTKMYSIKNIFVLYDIIPLVLQDYYDSSGIFKKYLTENLLHCDKIISISNFTKNEFEKYCNTNGFKIPKISSILLPNQFRDTSRIIQEDSVINQEKIVILLPGTIEPRKQQILFMRMFLKFINFNPDYKVELVVYGQVVDSFKGTVNDLVSKSNGHIIYLGLISDEQIRELYKIASFLCFISIYEGYGFPVSESLWNGVPVLTSNSGSMAEIAVAGGCFTINTSKKEEIYNAIDILIKEPKHLSTLREQIKNTHLSTWSQYTDCIYRELIE